MGIFDDIIKTTSDGDFIFNEWVEWNHFLVPNKPQWFRNILRNILSLTGHCLNCSALDGCYFITNNMPNQPLHPNCDCSKITLSQEKVVKNAYAICDIRKFTEYVFRNTAESRGKNKIFYDLGFNIQDSEYLQIEMCRQAKNQYLLGNYRLKQLDKRGQRLAIPITLKNKHFYSGWLLCPEGKIQNTTPFGGWKK